MMHPTIKRCLPVFQLNEVYIPLHPTFAVRRGVGNTDEVMVGVSLEISKIEIGWATLKKKLMLEQIDAWFHQCPMGQVDKSTEDTV